VATSGNILYQNSKITFNYFSHSSYYFTAPRLTHAIKNQNINPWYNNRTMVTNHHWISSNNRASGPSICSWCDWDFCHFSATGAGSDLVSYNNNER